jgi:hypothetical protein
MSESRSTAVVLPKSPPLVVSSRRNWFHNARISLSNVGVGLMGWLLREVLEGAAYDMDADWIACGYGVYRW